MAQTHTLRKEAGIVGLLYASLGGIIGSGWLGRFRRATSRLSFWKN